MQNAMNNMEKKATDTAWKVKNEVVSDLKSGVSDLKSIANDTDLKSIASDLTARVSDLSEKVRAASGDAYKESVSFVKRNPIRSALGLAAVGYFIGVLTARARK